MSESEKIIRREITSWGHHVKDDHGEKCGSCEKLDNLINNEIIPKSSVPIEYKMNDIYTEEGRKYAETKKIEEMPYTESCDIYDSGKKDCKEIKGFDAKDFEHLKDKREPEPEVQTQL